MINMYAVHSLDLVNYLCMAKNRILKIENATNDPTGKLKVCLFADTEKLHSDINNYMLMKEQKRLLQYRKKKARETES